MNMGKFQGHYGLHKVEETHDDLKFLISYIMLAMIDYGIPKSILSVLILY